MRPKDLVARRVDAFNNSDAAALAAFYAETAIKHQVAQEQVHGRDAIKEMFQREFAQADMTCIVQNLFEDGEWAILEGRIRGIARSTGPASIRS